MINTFLWNVYIMYKQCTMCLDLYIECRLIKCHWYNRIFILVEFSCECYTRVRVFFLNTVKYHIKVLVSVSYQYTFSQMNNSEINHIPITCFFNLSSELSFQNLTPQIRKYDHKPDSDLIKIKSNSPKRYLFVSKTSRNCSYYIKIASQKMISRNIITSTALL